MIASGLFVIPGIAFARTGPSIVLAYGITALIALPTVFSAAELSTAMPKAGGIYFFASRGIGYAAGSIAGFARWFSITLKSAYALLGIGFYTYTFTEIEPIHTALGFCLLFLIVNLIGIRMVGKTQVLFTVALLGVLVFLIVGGLFSIEVKHFTPFFTAGFSSVFSTAGFIFISYGGILAITGLAEEVRKPRRNIPLGMILGLLVTGLVYTAVVFIIVGTIEAGDLMKTLTPVADSARISFGQTGFLLATLAALLAFVTTANAGLASASRYPLAMSRDRLLPNIIQKNINTNGVPYISILLTGLLMLLAIVFLELEILVEIASSLLMLTYILTNLALLLLRKKTDSNYKPTFKAPLYPWLQIISIIGLLLLLLRTGTISLLVSAVFCLAAYIWYLTRAKLLTENTIPLPPEPKNATRGQGT